jgi:hypothetical protein
MFNKNFVTFLIVVLAFFTTCSTNPKQTNINIVPVISDNFRDSLDSLWEDHILGFAYNENEYQRKEEAFSDFSQYISCMINSQVFDWSDCSWDMVSYVYHSSSLITSYIRENGIVVKEYSDGNHYAIAIGKADVGNYMDHIKKLPAYFWPVQNYGSIQSAVSSVTWNMGKAIPENSTIAIINISAKNPDDSEFVIEELSTNLTKEARNKGYTIVDRRSLDAIRSEHKFQLSGDVDDDTIVSIGQFLGANVVITGSITGENEYRRLRVKALDAKTARLYIQTNLKY